MFNCAGIAEKFDDSGMPGGLNANPNVANKASRIRRPATFVVFHEPSLWDVNDYGGGGSRVVSSGEGTNGGINYHVPFFEDPTSCAVFADWHAVYLTHFSGLGTKTIDFKLVPDWL